MNHQDKEEKCDCKRSEHYKDQCCLACKVTGRCLCGIDDSGELKASPPDTTREEFKSAFPDESAGCDGCRVSIRYRDEIYKWFTERIAQHDALLIQRVEDHFKGIEPWTHIGYSPKKFVLGEIENLKQKLIKNQ